MCGCQLGRGWSHFLLVVMRWIVASRGEWALLQTACKRLYKWQECWQTSAVGVCFLLATHQPYPPLTNNPFSSTNFFPPLLDGRDRDNLGLERAVKPGVPRIDLDQAVISNLRHHRVSTYSLPYNLKGKGAVFFFYSIQCFFCAFSQQTAMFSEND